MTPKARTLAALRKAGVLCADTERFVNPPPPKELLQVLNVARKIVNYGAQPHGELGHAIRTFDALPERRAFRQDLFGFADLVAVGWLVFPAVFVQVTDASHRADRFAKMIDGDVGGRVRKCLAAGSGVALVTWKLITPKADFITGKGGGRPRWTARVEQFVERANGSLETVDYFGAL